MKDTAIHVAGRDIMIIYNYHTYPEPELVLAPFCMCHIFGMTSMDHRSFLQTFFIKGPMYFW